MNSCLVANNLSKNARIRAKEMFSVRVGDITRKRKNANFFLELNPNSEVIKLFLAPRTAIMLKRKQIQHFKVIIYFFKAKFNIHLIITGSGRSVYLTSPNYPNNYPNYQYLAWIAWTGSPYAIGFNFETFDLEEGYDWVRITDQVSGKVLFHNYPRGAASGEQRIFGSDSHRVLIEFYTDYSVTRKGFNLKLWASPSK